MLKKIINFINYYCFNYPVALYLLHFNNIIFIIKLTFKCVILFVYLDKVHNEKLKKIHSTTSIKSKFFDSIDNASNEGKLVLK